MKRFATPSKASLIRHEFRKLPIGAVFNATNLANLSGFNKQIASAAIWYLFQKGAVRLKDNSIRPHLYEKIANDDITDCASHGPKERVIVRRKENVIAPAAFQSTEAADLKAANELLRAQLKSKMEEILTTLAEIDDILDTMK